MFESDGGYQRQLTGCLAVRREPMSIDPLIKRRECRITLAREEWEHLILGIAGLPEATRAFGRTISELRAELERSACPADRMLCVSRSPLAWSGIVVGLSLHVLRRPDLLIIAERLRAQLSAQAKCLEGRVDSGWVASLRAWPRLSAGASIGQIGAN
jgi:hypothetical protein